MEMFGKIRRMFFRDGKSRSEIARRTGLSRTTIKKWVRPALNSPMATVLIVRSFLGIFPQESMPSHTRKKFDSGVQEYLSG